MRTVHNYSKAFKFSILDIYSNAPNYNNMLTSNDYTLVDNSLKSLIVPHGELTVYAISSIQEKSSIEVQQLLNILEQGTESEQQVALRALTKAYPEVAITYIQNIIKSDGATPALYNSAIAFIPRLINKTEQFDEDQALCLIDSVLDRTNDLHVQTSCVRVLEQIGSTAAADILKTYADSIPVDLIEHFVQNTGLNINTLNQLTTNAVDRATNYLGNAIYRDGVCIPGTSAEINWHTAIVAHADGPYTNRVSTPIIHHPGARYGERNVVCFATYKEFLDSSIEQGQCYMSNMSSADRTNIYFTAVDLVNEAIPYTLLNLVSVHTSHIPEENYHLKYSMSEINAIRCDGVVEYCYEYNGIRLQGKPIFGDISWNISTYRGILNHPIASMTPKTQYNTFDFKLPRS